MFNLSEKSDAGQQLTPDEALLRKLLREKQDKKINCERDLRYSRVDQLTPP